MITVWLYSLYDRVPAPSGQRETALKLSTVRSEKERDEVAESRRPSRETWSSDAAGVTMTISVNPL